LLLGDSLSYKGDWAGNQEDFLVEAAFWMIKPYQPVE
jgi:hypothetical protein